VLGNVALDLGSLLRLDLNRRIPRARGGYGGVLSISHRHDKRRRRSKYQQFLHGFLSKAAPDAAAERTMFERFGSVPRREYTTRGGGTFFWRLVFTPSIFTERP
jgi:hypothetical protein